MKPTLRTVPSAPPAKQPQMGNTLLTGMKYHNAASHSDVNNLKQRMKEYAARKP